jgi:hypothetical protein
MPTKTMILFALAEPLVEKLSRRVVLTTNKKLELFVTLASVLLITDN